MDLRAGLFGYVAAMWLLILIGGGIAVTILGPISISGYGELNMPISSAIKAVIAILLVILWVLVLSKLKKWIFRKEIQS